MAQTDSDMFYYSEPSLPAHHPINALSKSQKFGILVTLSFSGFLAKYNVATTQTAFTSMGHAFAVSPGKIPNTIGYALLGLAVGPLIWNPLSRVLSRPSARLYPPPASPTFLRLLLESQEDQEESSKELSAAQTQDYTLDQSVTEGKVGPAWMPWSRPKAFLSLITAPILMVRYLSVTLTSIYYGMLFAWSVGITIVMPQLYEKRPYDFGEVAVGCAFLAFGVGAVLGKWSGGIVGDKMVSYFSRRSPTRIPEHRLYGLIPLLPFMMVALAICGIAIQRQLHWIARLVGGGLFFFCLSAATGLLQTYVSESYIVSPMDAQAVFVFFKSIWGFAIAFFVMERGEEKDFISEYLIQGALPTGLGALLCAGALWKGQSLRKWQEMPME
ncbi:unnamed protein product [Jaminaea pallidilutea]